MKLTEKQESFAQLIAGGNTQADAYREAYDAENMTNDSVHQEASRVIKNLKVATRVKQLKEELEIHALWSKLDSVKVLSQIAKKGEREGDKVNAVKTINSMHGWDKQVIDHTSSDQSMSPKGKSLDDFYSDVPTQPQP
jgi:hypothetical protein